MKKTKINLSSTRRDFKSYSGAYQSMDGLSVLARFNIRKPQTAEVFLANTEIISVIPGFHTKTIFVCDLVYNEDGNLSIECARLGIYSTGESRKEAIKKMQENIASLFDELNEDDAFSEDWLKVKRYLNKYLYKDETTHTAQ